MDERTKDEAARRGDDLPQDGLGRDMAHGSREDDRYQGGSTGRSTSGRAGSDALPRGADERSPEPAEDTAAAGGAHEGLDLAERDDVRRRDPTTH